jgi:hypothetical protein
MKSTAHIRLVLVLTAMTIFALFLLCQGAPSCSTQPQCPYPALPKTGVYQLIPNGGFETVSGTSQTQAEFWNIASGWQPYYQRDTANPIFQLASLHMTESWSHTGPGIAAVNGNIPVTPGQTYVLSGYVINSIIGGGQAYLDLADVSFDVSAFSTSGSGDTEFVCAEFTVPSGVTAINVRAVVDGTIQTGSNAYFDEVAVTPKSSFVRPPAIK